MLYLFIVSGGWVVLSDHSIISPFLPDFKIGGSHPTFLDNIVLVSTCVPIIGGHKLFCENLNISLPSYSQVPNKLGWSS